MKTLIATGLAAALLAACAGGNSSISSIPAAPTSQQQVDAMQSDQPAAVADSTTVPLTTSTNFGGFADGSSYAARITVSTSNGVRAVAGPVAPAELGCNVVNNRAYNSVATLNVAPYVLSSGTAADSVASTYTTTAASASSTSTVQGVSLLKGLIKATAVKAQANSGATSAGATSNESGSQLAGLTVAGVPISVLPVPNTRISLTGIGYVTLNEVYSVNNSLSSNGTRSTLINVNMIHVVVTTPNALGIAVGTEIIVASAHSSFTVPPAPYEENATAYSLYAHGYAGNLSASSGPWAPASIGCHSFSDTDRLASASTPVGSLGTMVNTVANSVSSTSTATSATSSTAAANVLNGLITAQALVAKANVNRSGTAFTRKASLTFTSLKIAGTAISISVAPNTRVSVSGVGYAIVNEQAGSTSSSGAVEEINAVVLHVTTSNIYNLPVGAVIVVGHAHTAIAAI